MRALKLIVAIEAAILAAAVALVLHSEGHPRVPAAVAVVSAAPAVSRVPVSIDVGSRGTIRTTTLSLARGRQATARGSVAAGMVGFRRSTAHGGR